MIVIAENWIRLIASCMAVVKYNDNIVAVVHLIIGLKKFSNTFQESCFPFSHECLFCLLRILFFIHQKSVATFDASRTYNLFTAILKYKNFWLTFSLSFSGQTILHQLCPHLTKTSFPQQGMKSWNQTVHIHQCLQQPPIHHSMTQISTVNMGRWWQWISRRIHTSTIIRRKLMLEIWSWALKPTLV